MSATAPNPDGGMPDSPELEVYGLRQISDSPDIEPLFAVFFGTAASMATILVCCRQDFPNVVNPGNSDLSVSFSRDLPLSRPARELTGMRVGVGAGSDGFRKKFPGRALGCGCVGIFEGSTAGAGAGATYRTILKGVG